VLAVLGCRALVGECRARPADQVPSGVPRPGGPRRPRVLAVLGCRALVGECRARPADQVPSGVPRPCVPRRPRRAARPRRCVANPRQPWLAPGPGALVPRARVFLLLAWRVRPPPPGLVPGRAQFLVTVRLMLDARLPGLQSSLLRRQLGAPRPLANWKDVAGARALIIRGAKPSPERRPL
jgi:hypothetical protein